MISQLGRHLHRDREHVDWEHGMGIGNMLELDVQLGRIHDVGIEKHMDWEHGMVPCHTLERCSVSSV